MKAFNNSICFLKVTNSKPGFRKTVKEGLGCIHNCTSPYFWVFVLVSKSGTPTNTFFVLRLELPVVKPAKCPILRYNNNNNKGELGDPA